MKYVDEGTRVPLGGTELSGRWVNGMEVRVLPGFIPGGESGKRCKASMGIQLAERSLPPEGRILVGLYHIRPLTEGIRRF